MIDLLIFLIQVHLHRDLHRIHPSPRGCRAHGCDGEARENGEQFREACLEDETAGALEQNRAIGAAVIGITRAHAMEARARVAASVGARRDAIQVVLARSPLETGQALAHIGAVAWAARGGANAAPVARLSRTCHVSRASLTATRSIVASEARALATDAFSMT